MVFNILANNTDDHNKNFSFLMDERGVWRLSPAYDLTYIFNTGGFLPETTHCLMMRGKASGHSMDDVMAVANENGIRKAESIIREVAEAIKMFRYFAERNGVREKWIGSVENCLSSHLENWGLNQARKCYSFELNGMGFSNVYLEQAYKGNYHLYVTVDGRERKFVIGPKKEEYSLIDSTGLRNLTEDQMKAMVARYFIS